MDEIRLYVINHNNRSRERRMRDRLTRLDIKFEFTKGCNSQDRRIKSIPKENRHAAPCMLAHLDAISRFVKSGYEFGIICEDDIHIKKSFKEDIIAILSDFKIMKLDILLLGYLINFDPKYLQSEKFSNHGRKYYDYPMELWGAQMYLLSRSYALFCLNTFNLDFAQGKFPFSSDWTITKAGNKALIYPMLAVEEGRSPVGNSGQKDFHRQCHECNFTPDYL